MIDFGNSSPEGRRSRQLAGRQNSRRIVGPPFYQNSRTVHLSIQRQAFVVEVANELANANPSFFGAARNLLLGGALGGAVEGIGEG